MLNRLKDAIEAGRNAVAEAGDAESARSVVALLVLDELGDMADDIHKRHLDLASASDHRALFILGPDSEPEHGDVKNLCEALPRGHDIATATGIRPDNILRYRLARLRLILEKWEVSDCHWIGDSAAELVEAWNDSEEDQHRPVSFHPTG